MKFEMTINRILGIIIIFLAFMIISTTLIIGNQKKKGFQTVVTAIPGNETGSTAYSSYKGLGTLRTTTAPDKSDKNGTTVVLRPYLTYEAGDREFYEELSRKNQLLKSIFIKYFSSYTKNELKKKGETAIKQEILSKVNENLTLNKISEVYFEDLNYLEIPDISKIQ